MQDLSKRMTNALVGSVSMADVIVGLRRRKKTTDLAALSKSLERHGLIHPIVVSDKGELVAGCRRYSAALRLGWKKIPARRLKLSDDELRELELAENEERSDLDAYESAKIRMREIETLAVEIRRESSTGAKSRKSPESLKRGSQIEARKRLGIPQGTAVADQRISADVDEFPVLESWSKRNIKRTAEALRDYPPAERKDAEFFAGTFGKREAQYAAEALENMIDNRFAEKLRKEIWKRSRSKDPEIVERAQTTAASLYPVPDAWYGQLKAALDDVAEIVKKRKKRDYAAGRIRAAHQELVDAVRFLENEYTAVRNQALDELKGKAK